MEITPQETLELLRLDLAHREAALNATLADPTTTPDLIMTATAIRVVLRQLAALIGR